MAMKICEIFAGIQGESTYAGLPCVFVRTAGCNLRCTYCDTTYAYEEDREMTEDEIISEVCKFGVNLVEITGGEPLLQDNVISLISKLLDIGLKVLVETNGSVDIGNVDQRATIIMDVKTPGSRMSHALRIENFEKLKTSDELKFVLTDKADYDWAKDIVFKFGLSNRCIILFSPAFGLVRPSDLAGWILSDRLSVRLNLQLHKYIYPPDQRGV
ncbi:MAG TPA: radical SAM protein [Dissulfurispiraceae bacterium]|nr:radical SAM protein [Dissulfurispiraceae bacterium]